MTLQANEKWDRRFLELAKHIAGWSRDPSTQTGAVIVDPDRRVVSVGYNGFPRGVDDSEERYANRELKYRMIMHCECNAILFAGRSVKGCTMYNWPMAPCAQCAALMIQAGIARSVSPPTTNERWLEDFAITKQMFAEAAVMMTFYDGEV